MDDGFQGFFVLLVVAFWVLEAVLSARRKRQSGLPLPGEVDVPGEVGEAPARAEGPQELPGREVWQDGRDHREDYRTLPQRPTGRPMTYGERHGESVPQAAAKAGEKASGMVPRDLWEELAALARGERPRAPDSAPAPVPVEGRAGTGDPIQGGRTVEEVAAARRRDGYDLPTRRRETAAPETRREIVGSDAAMAARVRHTPALRLSTPAEETGTGTAGGSRKQRGILRSLAGGVTSRELRRAVILHEVLGPPVALRGSEWESQEGEGVRRPGLG